MLHRLRHAHLLARLVLAWFVLSLGVAMASPVVNPQATEMVCSAAGVMKLLVVTGDSADDATVSTSQTMDCPLCLSMSAPPVQVQAQVVAPHPLSYALQSIPAARIAALTGAPLPARGPPAL
jgi:hypothetical protein